MEKSNISLHITYQEATANSHGFSNTPDEATIARMKYVAEKVFEPLRALMGVAITVSSFFRSVLLNRFIGGVYNSQHVTGEAMDLQCRGFNKKMFFFILEHLEFDQLIWEFGNDDEPSWVHVSLKKEGNRKQALRSIKVNGKTKYLPYA